MYQGNAALSACSVSMRVVNMTMELLCTAGILAKLVFVVKEKWRAQQKSALHPGVQILWGYLVSAVQNVHVSFLVYIGQGIFQGFWPESHLT